MLLSFLFLYLVHLSRQHDGFRPFEGAETGEPTVMGEEDVVATGWYQDAEAANARRYTWVDPPKDANIVLLNDSTVLNHTEYEPTFIYHYQNKDSRHKIELSAVQKMFKSFENLQFDNGYISLATNTPSMKIQNKLNMTKLPCLALHWNDMDLEYYNGTVDRQGIIDFLSSHLGKVELDEGTPLELKKGVFVVNKYNYKKFVQGPIFAMLFFHEKSCSACGASLPAFEKLMAKYNHSDDQIWLGQFQTTKVEALLNYNITSLPAITYGMMGGKRFLYDNAFDAFSLEMFITEQMVFDETQSVIPLIGSRFYNFIKLKPVVIVKFISAQDDPRNFGYPDSNKFAAWSVMAQQWDHPAVFATINITEHKLKEREMLYYSQGKACMYKWGKFFDLPFTYTDRGDYELLQSVSKVISKEVQDYDSRMMGTLSVDETIILGLFPGKSDMSEVYHRFEEGVLSYEKRKDLTVIHSFSWKAAQRFKVKGASMVVVYPPEAVTENKETPSYRVIPISITDTPDHLANVIQDHCNNPKHFPLISSIDYTGIYFDDPSYTKHLVTIYLPLDWGIANWSNMNYWSDKIKPLAIEYKKQGIIFVYADEDVNYDVIQELGIREGTISELIFAITNNELQRVFYPAAEEYEAAGSFTNLLKSFVDKYIAGNVLPKIRSQKAVDIVRGNVSTVVGSNVEHFMVPKDGVLSVTLMIREHTPEVLNTLFLMELLAEKYAHIDTLQFGKFNLASNDLFFSSPKENWLTFSDVFKKRIYNNMLPKCTVNVISFEGCLESYGITLYTKDEPRPAPEVPVIDEEVAENVPVPPFNSPSKHGKDEL